uniref:3-alpha-hydroxysteroid sulfotransferase-like n=1 Tax=Jaculus jaculus TaxID=51337 RepID=UPI001E1B2664|nr:3-alpha-hydroxysteroid sulfotransferase-like [Jaculus jaculus]
MKDPRLFTSHLPIQLFPKSFSSTKAKVIYAIRNPRDALVSGYYFFSNSNFIKKPKSLEEYFEWFIQGKVPYGSWFEHIRGWMSMRDKDNFLMLSYEELKKDLRGTVEKICQFLGKQLEPKEVDLVLHYSSFHVMKENKMTKIIEKPDGNINFPLMRKGICGEWKDHFTSAQAETFDKVFQEKMAGFPRELLPWE